MQICKFKQTDLKISRMIIRVVEYIVIFYTYNDCPGVGKKIKWNHRHKKGSIAHMYWGDSDLVGIKLGINASIKI